MASSTVYKSPTISAFPSGVQYYSNTNIGASPVDIFTGTFLKIKFIHVDNSANSGAAVWFKLYNAAFGSVTVGTTVPWAIFKVAAGGTLTLAIPVGLPAVSDVSCACVTAGGTGGIAAPASAVSCKLWMTS